MIKHYSFPSASRTTSSGNKVSASYCNVHNTGYLPMSGDDKYRFSTSLQYVKDSEKVSQPEVKEDDNSI